MLDGGMDMKLSEFLRYMHAAGVGSMPACGYKLVFCSDATHTYSCRVWELLADGHYVATIVEG